MPKPRPITNDVLQRFKDALAHVESAAGSNTDHPAPFDPLQAGTRAGGQYAIMPRSLRDFVVQAKKGGIEPHPALSALAEAPDDVITETLNTNPLVDQLAGDMATRFVLQKAGGDPRKAAFLWNQGHNINVSTIGPRQLQHDYVRKFDRAYAAMGKLEGQEPPEFQPLGEEAPKESPPVKEPVLTRPEANALFAGSPTPLTDAQLGEYFGHHAQPAPVPREASAGQSSLDMLGQLFQPAAAAQGGY